MQKWEYCLLTQVPSGPVIVTITYYRPTGAETVVHRARSYDDASQRLWPQVFAELGLEGWELVSIDMGAFYFKRPLVAQDEA